MQISPISNNNTNFQARFIDSPKFKELSENAEIRKGITQKTLELGKKLKQIGKGQDLEILDSYTSKSCNGRDYTNVIVKTHYTGKKVDFVYPNFMPFWNGLLIELLQEKNKDFYEFANDADKFMNLVTEKDK